MVTFLHLLTHNSPTRLHQKGVAQPQASLATDDYNSPICLKFFPVHFKAVQDSRCNCSVVKSMPDVNDTVCEEMFPQISIKYLFM